jgi:hypothetical protein
VERAEIRHSHDIIADILSARAILRQAAVSGFNLDSPSKLALAEPEVSHLYRHLTAIDEALHVPAHLKKSWHLAEALRAKGELLLLQNKSNAAAAVKVRWTWLADREALFLGAADHHEPSSTG